MKKKIMTSVAMISFFVFGEIANSKTITRSATIGRSQTSIDFEETLLEGKMKAPQGFLLRGRKSQSLSEMVKLRSSFKKRILKSKHSVKAIAN